ncbi:MAG: glycosyltransferase [Daejeonella sp.]
MELASKQIFILGATRFDSSTKSTSFRIAKLLARNNFVYYIEYPVTWKDYYHLRKTEELEKRKSLFKSSSDGIIETEISNFKIIVSPLLLSINFLPEGLFYRALLKINELRIRKRIKKVSEKYNIKDFIYINSFNFHYPGLMDTLHPSLTVYHCVDPVIMPYDIRHGIVSENQLVKNSNLVICTSRQLYDEKKTLNSNTHFIGNAGDIAHSNLALSETLAIHESISALIKPVIGYVGTIERRIDYDLLKAVIENNKDKTFVFTGPVSDEYVPEWFKNNANVVLTGSIPYEEIPSLIKGFDIAIIPFKKDKISATIFPLKLFEYLGAGKPVVATDFNPDLEEFTKGTVSFCTDANSFSNAINDILKNKIVNDRELRLEIAKENTWERRILDFEELLDKNFAKAII